jgi:eukaryotic-like serine/threonine-protein kinase
VRAMDPERWRRIAALLDDVLDMPASERARFLDTACGDDAELRGEVEALLVADAEASSILDTPLDPGGALIGEEDAVLPAGAQIGAYRLVHELGRGGMGAVYLAERADGQFEHRVALKLVRGGPESADIVRRFLHERQILARLGHPHIARLLDGGLTETGLPFFVMEYVAGEPITTHCDRLRLPVSERLRLFTAVCDAVAYAHRNLIVHRDLKPSNILVTADGRVKLLDFGIAKLLGEASSAADDGQTRTGLYLLTPEYASPEQVRGDAITTATDVYALGAVLYELLSGRRAHGFAQRSPAEVARVVGDVTAPLPSKAVAARAREGGNGRHTSLAEGSQLARARATDRRRLERMLRGDLDAIVMKALRKEPEHRYPTVEALLADLDRQRAGVPVAARRGTVTYRAGRFLRRHRGAVAAAALVVLSLAGGLVAATRQADRAARESARARAVTDFLVGLFRVSDPSESRGRELTARELIDSGVARVAELEHEPELQAEMLTVLGAIYRELAVLPLSDSLLRRAVALRERLYGPDDERVVASLNQLGGLLIVTGDYEAADTVLRRALTIRERAFGARDTLVAVSLNNLALARANLGDDEEAERLYRRSLAIDRRVYGPGHLEVATALTNLGNALRRNGNYEAADSALTNAAAIRRRHLPAGDPEIADALGDLAVLRNAQGRPAEAELLHREALAVRRAAYGDAHPDVALSLGSLAATLSTLGRLDDAAPLGREALAIQERVLGRDHSRTITTLNNMAILLYRQGDLAAAAAAMRDALTRWHRTLGERHPLTLTGANNLGTVLTETGEYRDAEPLLRTALEGRRALYGGEHPDVAASLRNLGVLLHRTGRLTQAEDTLRRALDIARTALPAAHPRLAEVLTSYAELLLSRRRPAEAETLLREALAIRVERFGEEAASVMDVKRALAGALAAQGRQAEADALLVEGRSRT